MAADPTAIHAIEKAKDRELSGEAASWIDPAVFLPDDVFFVPSKATGHGGGHLFFGIVAALALLAVPGMFYVGAPDMATGALVISLVSALLAVVSHQRAKGARRNRQDLVNLRRWRFGEFWSAEHLLVREQANYCFLIPRSAVTKVYRGGKNVTINERNYYRDHSVNISYALGDDRESGLTLHARRARINSETENREARKAIDKQVALLNAWVRTSDIDNIRKAYALRDRSS
ncbi:MAG: hypothetical protein AAGD38_14105 [Acidobacteriota bacterium]